MGVVGWMDLRGVRVGSILLFIMRAESWIHAQIPHVSLYLHVFLADIRAVYRFLIGKQDISYRLDDSVLHTYSIHSNGRERGKFYERKYDLFDIKHDFMHIQQQH